MQSRRASTHKPNFIERAISISHSEGYVHDSPLTEDSTINDLFPIYFDGKEGLSMRFHIMSRKFSGETLSKT